MQPIRSTRSIYVIKSASGPVKIGVSVEPKRRFFGLEGQSAVPLSLEFVAKCVNGPVDAVEATAHKILQVSRNNGEWFATSVDSAIAAIRRAATQIGCDLVPYSVETVRITRRQQLIISSHQKDARKQARRPRHEALRSLLIERRQKAKLSQSEAGQRLGRTQNFISKIERGSHEVTVLELIELAEAMGFDPMAALRRVVKVKAE